jgi:hypothetical protein
MCGTLRVGHTDGGERAAGFETKQCDGRYSLTSRRVKE